jgi:hypothetical protein
MAVVVRHIAVNLVRAAKDRHSIKLRRKAAGWKPGYRIQSPVRMELLLALLSGKNLLPP